MSVLPTVDDIDVARTDTVLREAGGRILDRVPVLESVLLAVRDRYARAFVWATVQSNRLQYEAPIEPYRMLHVDPDRIEFTAEHSGPKYRHTGVVIGGDWDLSDTRFTDLDVYQAYEQHFVHGRPWSETAFYDRIVDEIRSGKTYWGCRTPEEFEARCERMGELYRSIETRGYLTQDELLDADIQDPIKPQNRLKTERLKDEIAVHIGRDGEILFEDGRNRLSIVKLLGLESVPVRVLRRHEQWQAIRDAYVTGDRAAEPYVDHPDIRVLDPDSTRE